MTDPDTLRELAPIAAERGGWSQRAVDAVDEQAVCAARQQARPGTRAHRALTALLGEKRKEART